MGRYARIVAPYFLQQGFSRHRFLPGPIEIAQDRRFFLGETHLAALWAEQQLRTRSEGVGPYNEYGVFTGFMLPELCTNARQKHRKPKRLGNVIVRTG